MNRTKAAAWISFALALLAALLTLGLLIYLGRGSRSLARCIGIVMFGAWGIAPYSGIATASLKMRRTSLEACMVLVGGLAIITFAGFVYHNGFFVHPDAQSGILFVFVPVYQWVGVAVALAIAYGLGCFAGRTERLED